VNPCPSISSFFQIFPSIFFQWSARNHQQYELLGVIPYNSTFQVTVFIIEKNTIFSELFSKKKIESFCPFQ